MAKEKDYAKGSKPRKPEGIGDAIDTATNVAAGAAAALGVAGTVAGVKKLVQREDNKSRRTRQQQRRLDRIKETEDRRLERIKKQADRRMKRISEKAERQTRRLIGGGGSSGDTYRASIGPDLIKPKLKRPGS